MILAQGAHIIVPGKRERNYQVVEDISKNDQIVKVQRTSRPSYINAGQWKEIPAELTLRRITYKYPTKNGQEECTLYTTILDPDIPAADIILKYAARWDIEISIREIKH